MKARRITRRGVRLIANYEGYLPRPYLDELAEPDVWTVGYGSTIRPNGEPVTRYRPVYLPKWRARRWLRNTAQQMIGDEINRRTRVGLNKNEFDALCSIGYNIGPYAMFEDSTFWKRLQAGDRKGCAEAMLWWDKAGGVTLLGLQRRRRREASLFLKPVS